MDLRGGKMQGIAAEKWQQQVDGGAMRGNGGAIFSKAPTRVTALILVILKD